jgi:hypothetical protein
MEPKIITQPEAPVSSEGPWKTIILTGIVAGTLDAIGAVVVYKANPAGIFQFIASGAFGAGKAFSSGPVMIFWGVLFHYIIAYSWTILFFFMYPVFSFMRKNRYVTGLLYGIFIWIIMNQVVIPLSEISQRPFNIKGAITGAAILMVAVSLPISILVHRYYARKGTL